MKRDIIHSLNEWRSGEAPKSLLLRGARQVGKTFSVRELGKSFPHFSEVNFDETPDAKAFFAGALTAAPLCEKLAAFTGVPIRAGETLLFLDEIQGCPEALAALRFFHEQMPDLHVIAAGSLLEFALQEIPTLGVGRITSRFMYPMTFREFITATGDGALLAIIDNADFNHPIDEPFHKKLLDLLRTYMWVGGMPEAVATYTSEHDLAMVQRVLDDLILTAQDDFKKYRRRTPIDRIEETFRSVAAQAGTKFKCSTVDPDAKSTSILNALSLLVDAGLVHRIYHTHARGLPLGAEMDSRRFKAMTFDLGIHQRMLGLNLRTHVSVEATQLVNKGSLAEVFVGLHLAAHQPNHSRPSLFYWHREARSSNAEVDYVIQRGASICPVEVKSGTQGAMQSMKLFLQERSLKEGIRLSMENFGCVDGIRILPLYAIHRLWE